MSGPDGDIVVTLEDFVSLCPLSNIADVAIRAASEHLSIDASSFEQIELYLPSTFFEPCGNVGGKASRGCVTGAINPFGYDRCVSYIMSHDDGTRLHEFAHTCAHPRSMTHKAQ